MAGKQLRVLYMQQVPVVKSAKLSINFVVLYTKHKNSPVAMAHMTRATRACVQVVKITTNGSNSLL